MSVKELAETARTELGQAYKVVCELEAATRTITASGGSSNQEAPGPGGSKNRLPWAIGLLAAGAILYQLNYKEPARAPEPPRAVDPIQLVSPSLATDQFQTPVNQPQSPPSEIVPFIHNDDLKDKAVRFRSGWETINGGSRFVVWGYDAANQPVLKFELYLDNGTYRLWRLYEIRYSADQLQVGVQRFKERGSVAEFKDQRNVSDAGDVLEQTTIYYYLSSGKLDSVTVDTPMIKGFDGLTISRYGGANLEGTRKRGGAPIRLGPDIRWLNDVFDLWSVFGEPNL